MSWDVLVVSTPSRDSDLAVFVTFDQARFLFNCPEGTQRQFVQKRLSMRKLKAVFFTDDDTRAVAGLPGLLLSAADAGVGHLDVAGSEALAQYLSSSRTFLQRDTLGVKFFDTPESGSKQVWSDKHLAVKAVSFETDEGGSQQQVPDGSFDWQRSGWKIAELGAQQLSWWRRQVIEGMFSKIAAPVVDTKATDSIDEHDVKPGPSMPPASWSQNAARMNLGQMIPYPKGSRSASRRRCSYILQAPKVRGKFDAAKARALGVPKGPSNGILASGKSLEIDDPEAPGGKRTILPEQVLEPEKEGGSCIIVDADESMLEQVVSSQDFAEYQGPDKNYTANVIIHRITTSLARDDRYRSWMCSFGRETQHILALTDVAGKDHVSFNSSAWNLLRMSHLDPNIFPPVIQRPSEDMIDVTSFKGLDGQVHLADPYLAVKAHPASSAHTVPRLGSDIPLHETDEEVKEALARIPIEMPAYDEAVRQVKGRAIPSDLPDHYSIVSIPLGTGSAIPSKYRNDIPGTGHILLDAGEGTLGQLHRRFDDRQLDDVFGSLRMIVISHMHADHHIGIRSMVEEWVRRTDQLEQKPNLYLVIPSFIQLHLRENAVDLPARVKIIDSHFIARNDWDADSGTERGDATSEQVVTEAGAWAVGDRSRASRMIDNARSCKEELGLTELFSPLVEHRGRAYGFVVAHKSGWKIVYSGDTKPCDNLVKFGKDATLLIHEATLEDDKPDLALKKGHSTFGQAIDVGVRMKAKYLLLNHFSQRYPKHPQIAHFADRAVAASSSTQPATNASLDSGPIVAMAYDLMVLPVKDFPKMEVYMPALEALFEEVAKEEGSENGGEGDGDAEVVGENTSTTNEKAAGKDKKQKGQGQGQRRSKDSSSTPNAGATSNRAEKKKARAMSAAGAAHIKSEGNNQQQERQKVGEKRTSEEGDVRGDGGEMDLSVNSSKKAKR